jgi:hypothetical protein
MAVPKSANVTMQPEPGRGPFAINRGSRNIQHGGGSTRRKAAKKLQFHNPGLPLVEAGQFV